MTGKDASRRDAVDLAEDFVAYALGGDSWECRQDNVDPVMSWIERGVGEDCERFLDVPINYDNACRIERLLEVARGHA